MVWVGGWAERSQKNMKKISEKQRRHAIHTAALRFKRNLQSRIKKRGPKRSGREIHFSQGGREWARIYAPEIMDLSTHYDQTIEFINSIRRNLKPDTTLDIRFKRLSYICSSSALLLAAEVYRWMRIKGVTPKVHSKVRWNANVRRLLTEMGLFKLIKARRAPTIDEADETAMRFIHFRTGNRPTGEDARDLADAIRALAGGDKLAPGTTDRQALYRGLSEAMVNVAHHAYDEHEDPGDFPTIEGQWWMSASFHGETRRMTVSFFDQGVGIPATLPKTHKESLAAILAYLRRTGTDPEMISAAMEIGRTQTNEPNRGKGLKDIRRFTELAPSGKLTIYSRKGKLTYSSEAGEELQNLPTPIGGTLIHWEAVI